MKSFFLILMALVSLTSLALTHSVPALDAWWASVVLIEVNAKDDTGEIVPGYCTAALLDANLILTAAHCVNEAIAMNDRGVQVTTGHYVYHKMPDGTQKLIGYMPDHPLQFNGTFLISDNNPGGTDDVAVIILDSAMSLPANFPFAHIVSPTEASGMNQNLLAYAPTVVSDNPVAEISSTNTLSMAALNNLNWSSTGNYQSQSSSRLEPGDSGAPLFVKTGNDWKILAVVKGQAKTFFSDWDVFESLSTNLCKTVSGRVSAEVQKQLCLN